MKKLLFIISFFAIAGTATAQHIAIEKGTGDIFAIELSELKQITFNGTTVNIENNTGAIYSSSMGDISRIYFDDLSSIADIEQQGGNLVEYLTPDEIAINSEAGSMVTIYSLTGTQLLTRRIDAQGDPISIASLPQGIYIVKANGRTTKILKR